MNPKPKQGDEHELAKGITVGDYVRLKSQMDREGVVEMIRRRFRDRYLKPVASIPAESKSGFCMVAIGCLMIEALESFYQGWASSNGKSKWHFVSSSNVSRGSAF